MNSNHRRVVIIGGGITGLAAAYRLQSESRQRNLPLDITLLEREPRLGGKIFTVRDNGFVIEGGPDSFLAAKPPAIQLCEELGIANRLIGTNDAQRRTFIYSRGRLHDLPEGLSSLVPSRLSPLMRSSLLSPIGKARVLMDWVLPARHANDDESLASFMHRRLGREAFERLIEPLMGGIYAGDAHQLSLNATFPQLRQLELTHGSLLRGVMRRTPIPRPTSPLQRVPPFDKSRTHALNPAGQAGEGESSQSGLAEGRGGGGFLSLRGGMGELVNALVDPLDIDLQCGRAVRAIRREPNAYTIQLDGSAIGADAVIVTTPAYVTANLLGEIDARLAESHRAIPHVSTATVSLAYRRQHIAHPLHGFGFVVPSVERRAILACTWSSNKFR